MTGTNKIGTNQISNYDNMIKHKITITRQDKTDKDGTIHHGFNFKTPSGLSIWCSVDDAKTLNITVRGWGGIKENPDRITGNNLEITGTANSKPPSNKETDDFVYNDDFSVDGNNNKIFMSPQAESGVPGKPEHDKVDATGEGNTIFLSTGVKITGKKGFNTQISATQDLSEIDKKPYDGIYADNSIITGTPYNDNVVMFSANGSYIDLTGGKPEKIQKDHLSLYTDAKNCTVKKSTGILNWLYNLLP